MHSNYVNPFLEFARTKLHLFCDNSIILDTADLLDCSGDRKDCVLALSFLPAHLSTLPFFLFVFFSSRLESLFSPSQFFEDVYQKDAES